MAAEWELEIGDITNRREVMERYGGSRFGGIEPSNTTPNVMIYSDPTQGSQHGYDYDGWDPHGGSPVYYYTGEGQVGHQDPDSKGNGAILRHLDTGRSLRLFEAAGPNRGGGKPQRYVGEFHVDPADPWHFREAPDRAGDMRHVVVFKLIALEPLESRSASEAGTVQDLFVTESSFDERQLREVALQWLERRTDGGRHAVTADDLGDFSGGFTLVDPHAELWQPPGFDAVLSVRDERDVTREQLTLNGLKVTPPDAVRADSLQAAETDRLPIIWFQAIGGQQYLPIYPLYVVGQDVDGSFVLSPDETFGRIPEEPESALEAVMKRYVMAETKRRLHQPVFRAHVLRAYDRRCAVCALRHVELLDAAHIIPDSDEFGVPAVQNGLALCKLHHSAYDALLLGITPDAVVEIAPRILLEVDGPTLKHGLQGRHGQKLMALPARRSEWPDPQALALRYEAFRANTAG